MRVEAVELRRVQIPLKRAFKHALHERKHTDAVFVTVFDADGKTGWGEVQPRPYVTGETIDGVLEETGPALAQRLLGSSFGGVDDVTAWLDDAAGFVGQGLATLCGFDLALLSLATEGAVEQALGGIKRDPLPPGVIIGFEHETKKLARYCATLRLAGRNHVKVKVGLDDDVERLRAVAKVWKGAPVRLDANAAWTPEEAVERLRAIAEVVPIASIEQPVEAKDLAGLRRIREETGVKVMADESVCSLADARRLVEAHAADIFNVRLGKNGGLWASRRLVEFAGEAGVEVHLGTMVGESGVLSAASEVFGRCVDGFACLDGKGQNAFLLEVDILDESSEHPAVAQARVQDHQVGPTRRLENA